MLLYFLRASDIFVHQQFCQNWFIRDSVNLLCSCVCGVRLGGGGETLSSAQMSVKHLTSSLRNVHSVVVVVVVGGGVVVATRSHRAK